MYLGHVKVFGQLTLYYVIHEFFLTQGLSIPEAVTKTEEIINNITQEADPNWHPQWGYNWKYAADGKKVER